MANDIVNAVLWSLCVVVSLYPLEWLFPAQKGQPILLRVANLLYLPFAVGFGFFVQPYVNDIAGVLIRSGSILPTLLIPPKTPGSIFLFSVVYALLWDFWQYWSHRLQHSKEMFGATHKFHHSETALNATTSARTHLASHLLFLFLYLPMLLFLGSFSPHWIAAFVMFRLWGCFIHANLRLHLGVLTPVIAGPQWHRIHHSCRLEHQNKNFATLFPFIDLIFGTYYKPTRNEYPETGLLPEDQHVQFLDDATVEPFRVWKRLFGYKNPEAVKEVTLNK